MIISDDMTDAGQDKLLECLENGTALACPERAVELVYAAMRSLEPPVHTEGADLLKARIASLEAQLQAKEKEHAET